MTPSSRSGGQDQKTIWNLGGLTLWELSRSVVRDAIADDLIGRASGLAFDFLLALFPLLVFLFTLFGSCASGVIQLRPGWLSSFAACLPQLALQLMKDPTEGLATNASEGKLTI